MDRDVWIGVGTLWLIAGVAALVVRRLIAWNDASFLSTPEEMAWLPRWPRRVITRVVPALVAASIVIPIARGMSVQLDAAWAAAIVPAAVLIAGAVALVIWTPLAVRRVNRVDEAVTQILEQSRALLGDHLDDEARELVRDALVEYPNDARLCAHGAVLALPDDRSDPVAGTESRELARRAVALAPTSASILLRAAWVMCTLREYADARGLLARADARLASDDQQRAELLYLEGLVFAGEDDDERAEAAFRAAFAKEPDGRGYGVTLADFLARRDRFDDALEVATAALRHQPGNRTLIEVRDEIRRCMDE